MNNSVSRTHSIAPNERSGASHSRRSAALACSLCRRRKVRCDATSLVDGGCQNCIHAGVPCAYPEASRRPGPKPGYVGRLETRLATLEEMLGDLTGNVRPAELVQMGGYLLPAPAATGAKRKRTQNATSDVHLKQSLPYTGFAPLTSAMDDPLVNIPPLSVILPLLNQLFSRPQGQIFPIVHPPSLLRGLKAHGPGFVPPVLLFALLSLGADMIGHRSPELAHQLLGDPERASKAFSVHSRQLIDYMRPNVAAVRAQCALIGHNAHRGQFRALYVAAGVSVRMSLELGLNRLDAPSQDVDELVLAMAVAEGVSPVHARESLRRLWWCVYISDRFSASANHKPIGVDERDCLVRLPCDDTAWWNESISDDTGPWGPYFDPSISSVAYNGVDLFTRQNLQSCVIRLTNIVGRILRHVSNVIERKVRTDGAQSLSEIGADPEFGALEAALLAFPSSVPTHLPCHASHAVGIPEHLSQILSAQLSGGHAWLSSTQLGATLGMIFLQILYHFANLMLHDPIVHSVGAISEYSSEARHWLVSGANARVSASLAQARQSADAITEMLWRHHLLTRSSPEMADDGDSASVAAFLHSLRDTASAIELPYAAICLHRAAKVHLAVAKGLGGSISDVDRARCLVMARKCREILGLVAETNRRRGDGWELGKKQTEDLDAIMEGLQGMTMESSPMTHSSGSTAFESSPDFASWDNRTSEMSLTTDSAISMADHGEQEMMWEVANDLGLTGGVTVDGVHHATVLQDYWTSVHGDATLTTDDTDLLALLEAENRHTMFTGMQDFDLEKVLASLFEPSNDTR